MAEAQPDPATLLVVTARGRQNALLSAMLGAGGNGRGLRVDWAASLPQALRLLEEGRWSACLVDEDLGAYSGLDLVRQARQAGIRLPFVLFLQYPDSVMEDQAIATGATEVLVLSMASPAVLARTLHAAIVRGLAEIRLKSAQERFRRVFEACPVGLTISAIADGRFTEANPAFCRILGYTREEVVGKTSNELGLWKDQAARDLARDQLAALGAFHDLEMLVQDKHGRLVHLQCDAQIVEIGGEKAIVASTVDITGQRQAERELRRRGRQLDAIERATGAGSWDYDCPTGAMRWSPNLTRVLGLTDAEASLDGLLGRVHVDDRMRVTLAMRHAAASGTPVDVGLRVVAGSSVAPMRMLGHIEMDVQGHPILVTGVLVPVARHEPPAGQLDRESEVTATRPKG